MPKNSISLAAKSIAVLAKDIRCEFRSRYALNAILLFGITTLTVVSFSIGQKSLAPSVNSALFWIIIFFSAMSGLAQVFVREEESKTSTILKLTADPNAVLLGKLAFNLLLLFLLDLIIAPMFIMMTDVTLHNPLLFVTILFIGSVGLAGATTLIAAIISRAGVKGALFAVLSFPILLPLLISTIAATSASFSPEANQFADVAAELKILVSFAVVMVTASILLFEFVWEE